MGLHLPDPPLESKGEDEEAVALRTRGRRTGGAGERTTAGVSLSAAGLPAWAWEALQARRHP